MSGNRNDPNRWEYLLNEANEGRLVLDPSVGAGLADECEKCLLGLDAVLADTGRVARVDGFGGFDSSRALADKFTRKGSEGDDSIDKRVYEHIELVRLMRDTFRQAIANYEKQDAATARTIANL